MKEERTIAIGLGEFLEKLPEDAREAVKKAVIDEIAKNKNSEPKEFEILKGLVASLGHDNMLDHLFCMTVLDYAEMFYSPFFDEKPASKEKILRGAVNSLSAIIEKLNVTLKTLH